jgi:hypothetical protein
MVDYGIANGDTSMCGRAAPFLADMFALIGDICTPFPRNSHLSTTKLAPFSLNCTRTAELRTLNFAVARAGLALSRCRLQSPCAKSSRVRAHSARGLGSLTPPTAAPGTRSAGQALPSLEPGLGSPCPHLHQDWAHPAHICAGAGLIPRTSAPGLGSPRPHLLRDFALSERALRRCRRVQDGRRGPADHGGYLRADPRRDGARLRRRLPREDHAAVAMRTGGWSPVAGYAVEYRAISLRRPSL